MTIEYLEKNEFDPYYGRYIYKIGENIEIRQGFVDGKSKVLDFFRSIPNSKLMYRYEENKWNIKEILQHLIDTERIFMYRCFRIARNDKTPIAGFDQNIYVAPSRASHKSIENLLSEFCAIRDASISLLNSLSDEDLCQVGDADGGAMSARAAAFTIIGHEVWHMDIISEKYL